MYVIIVSGTPGTGKTTLTKAIANSLDFDYFDINRIISENRLCEGYDKKRKCRIVDIKRLNGFLLKKIIKNNKRNIILDSHLSHFLPSRYVDLCIITKCSLKVLERRLKKKGYDNGKIRENLDSEIFDICLEEARRKKHRIMVVDTSNGIRSLLPQTIKKVKAGLAGSHRFKPGSL